MRPEKLTFVIVNYNGARFLSGCIESIINQTFKVDEIIVVDNHSNDDSIKILKTKYPFVKVFVMEHNLGLTDAYNFGMSISKNDWVILSNNDIVLERRCVEILRNSIPNQRTVVTPLFVSIRPPHAKQSFPVRFFPSLNCPWSSLKLKFKFDGIFATDITGFGLLVLNRKEVGKIDKRFPLYFDEDDFSLECRRKGIEILLVSESKVLHYGSGTLGKMSFKKIRLFMNGWVAFRLKWFSPWLLLPSTLFAFIVQFYQHLFVAIHREELIAPYARFAQHSSSGELEEARNE